MKGWAYILASGSLRGGFVLAEAYVDMGLDRSLVLHL